MTTQNYLLINTSITPETCDNVVVWDGDTNTWSPPEGHIALLQETTPSKDWSWDATSNTWVLAESIGGGQIGYTWDGVTLTTNDPQPQDPPLNEPDTGVTNF
jgi:hypothetical protein